MSAHLPLIEIVRNGFVEGRHHGSVVALAADGSVAYAVGDVEGPVLPRSSNKPVQALAMLESGLRLRSDQLALACASHSGEPMHLEVVRSILADAGLGEDHLRNIEDLPLDDAAREAHLRAGQGRSRLAMNCSGKHAAMLATCRINDWDLEGYLAPDHPLQQRIAEVFARTTGEPIEVSAVDGCGAPLLSTSLTGLARAFATIATATVGPAYDIAKAVRAHPELVSGSTRDERTLLTAIPGAIGKAGAEAVYAVALPDGRAFALKIEDGGTRARPVVMAALLRHLGVDVEPGVDTDAVRSTGEAPVLGGGVPVGVLRPLLP